jgi:hypothetical protein
MKKRAGTRIRSGASLGLKLTQDSAYLRVGEGGHLYVTERRLEATNRFLYALFG